MHYNKQLSFIQNRPYQHLNTSANGLSVYQYQLEKKLAFLDTIKFKKAFSDFSNSEGFFPFRQLVRCLNMQKSIRGKLGERVLRKNNAGAEDYCKFQIDVNSSGTHIPSFLTFSICQMCLEMVDIDIANCSTSSLTASQKFASIVFFSYALSRVECCFQPLSS